MSEETSADEARIPERREKNQLLWFLLILAVFGLLFLGAFLVNWLLAR